MYIEMPCTLVFNTPKLCRDKNVLSTDLQIQMYIQDLKNACTDIYSGIRYHI